MRETVVIDRKNTFTGGAGQHRRFPPRWSSEYASRGGYPL